jgi:glycosyltransferase involved in cell wall biosynthesis
MIFEAGRAPRRRTWNIPSRAPYTYPIDVLLPIVPPRADLWLGFNNLSAWRGMVQKRLGRTQKVAYWAVDFVPERFGGGSPITRAYDLLDTYCCRNVDHRIELSAPARDGRDERLGIPPAERAPTDIVPVGAWLDGVPSAPADGYLTRRVIFVGHLVPRMGLEVGLEAVAKLKARGVDVELEVAGAGEHMEALQQMARTLGIEDRVLWHGYVGDPKQLQSIIAGGALTLAPYAPDPDSFTRFADPSKLKSYLAGGAPILLTDVPHNAHELEREAGSEVLPYEAEAWAAAIERGLADGEAWQRRRAASLAYAQGFDWNVLLADQFARMGFSDD